MVPLENLLAFALAAVVLIVIPGPSVLFTIGRSLALGRLGGLLSVLGNALGVIPLAAAVALGVGAIVAQSVVLFTTIKIIGALYLVYLGIQAIRHRHSSAAAATGGVAPRSHWRQLFEGFIVGITNPKTIAFFVAVLPQFVDFRAGMIPLQLFELGLVFIVLALICDSIWALAASAARSWFARSPRRASGLAATGGVMMIGLGGVLALSGNRH
ncbi:LysE family translocator [Agromyces aerolatus]|uniref:LysE family translocator n=1 Tax=Agromyces sp. LY-1074 TaxID=3074080 RepID=UPI0028565927|nr:MULTISPECIES: LysE family translocator [unclassified Agromyces]MDR5701531.1 LysE family translocator [Agromyces sp. LY-1074]MDR5707862.1 LysE family translocator [Agromyces sp. LY-1358]